MHLPMLRAVVEENEERGSPVGKKPEDARVSGEDRK